MASGTDDDDTVMIPPSSRRRPLIPALAGVTAVGVAAALWFVLSARAPPPAPAPSAPAPSAPAIPAPAPAPPATPPPATPLSAAPSRPVVPPAEPAPAMAAAGPDLPTAGEDGILAANPAALVAVRFADNPKIVVMEFPNEAEQGQMFDRLAALIELAAFPHDRIATEAEIAAQRGNQPGFYTGYDFRASDVWRFFALADATGVALLPQEQRLRALIQSWGWTRETNEAVITLPDTGNPWPDDAARAAVLRHELSHGEYFTVPAYADAVTVWWDSDLTAADRDDLRSFLARDGYDLKLEDLIRNESQAYLIHTMDARFGGAALFGMTQDHLNTIRVGFLAGMPPGWLKEATERTFAALGIGTFAHLRTP